MRQTGFKQSPFLPHGPKAAEGSAGTSRPRRLAFVGRTSTDDLQDPTISIPRQLQASWAALPADAAIVAFFFDVETGRADPATRGHGRAHEQFDLPLRRDGGIQDLLEEASRPDRRFDAVICESVDRIARRTFYGVAIEHALEQSGVPLLAADEPGSITDPRGTHATRVLTRRVKQGIAEWYVLDMLEKSRAGFEEHTRQGFNIGSTPYGYNAQRVPHPVPAKRAAGNSKTRLVPDPTTAPVVAQIFAWRVEQRMSYAAIAAHLDADPSRFPPPKPTDARRAVGHWTSHSIRGILGNPKYTGYMVWNRRATKRGGKVNAVTDWVCSAEPTHPPIISIATFTAAAEVGRSRQGSRGGAGRNSHPATRHTYLLRGYVFCTQCGRRMYGSVRRSHVYMMCPPKPARQAKPSHAGTVSVREEDLLDGLRQFLDKHLLGTERTRLAADTLRDNTKQADVHRRRRLDELDAQIQDLNQRRARLVACLEESTIPDSDLVHSVQVRMAELRAGLDQAQTARRDLAQQLLDEPNLELLDLLPTGRIRLDMPEPMLRQMFDLLRLEIHFDGRGRDITCRCTLNAVTIRTVVDVLQHGVIGALSVNDGRRIDECLVGKLELRSR
jgi:DNA invertase Pin-like site-specific DNA recombinase